MAEESSPLLQHTKTEEKLKLSALKSMRYGSSTEALVTTLPVESRLTYTWSDINVFVTEPAKSSSIKSFFAKTKDEPKHILKNVTGVAYPGELLAILGSSGAGKTTLLNALTFRSPSSAIETGMRCVNGVPVTHTALTSKSAYVQQEDIFFKNLTVEEHLKFHALVRMDHNMSRKQRFQRVEEVISELSLNKCRNIRIGQVSEGGISGGERKRLAFASEVLTNPSLMFCDEPTSGLDSFMALNVVQVLKNLAKTGKTVVCTIHQPSSELYAMFDKVLFLAEGRTAFLGTPDEADVFFSSLNAPCPHNYSPADYYIQLLAIAPGEEESCRQAIELICNNFDKSEYNSKITSASSTYQQTDELSTEDILLITDKETSPYKATWCAQFLAVLWRSWIILMKDPVLIRVRLLQTMMVAFLLGVIYFGQTLDENGVININGAIFIFLTSMSFQNIYVVVDVFCSDFPIFIREHTNGMYRTDVYFLCRTLAELPLFVFIPVLYISICYYMVGLNPDVYRFLTAVGILVLITNVVISFGYLISCMTNSFSMAMAVGPPIIIPFLLFGGFFLNISSIPIYFKWLSYFSWFRYGYEALLINQWSGIEQINCQPESTTCPSSGDVVLEIYNFSEDKLLLNIIMLVVLIIIYRVMAYFALVCKTFNRE